MEQKSETRGTSEIPQYSLSMILLVWAAAALPMGLVGWVVTPALVRDPANPGFERLALLTVGLIWQFVLTMVLLHREIGQLRWSAIRLRLWLVSPRLSQAGKPNRHLWWWLVPVVLLTALFDLRLRGTLNALWVSVVPWLAEPDGADLGSFLSTPEARAQLVGNWGVLALFVISALFNTVLGEELLFRGLLLPRMAGVFGGGIGSRMACCSECITCINPGAFSVLH